jgi:glyoxylase-like metal-dependent hydrolase (beta-lactamase superfamily II)
MRVKTGGRKKGTPNKISSQIKEKLSQVIDETIIIHYFGRGHTDGDSVIEFENANVVHTGDSFIKYGLPYVDMTNGGNIEGFIKILDHIINLCDENTIIIPGHGGLSNVKEIVEMRDDLIHYYNLTIEGYKKGLNLEEISSSIKIELGKTSGMGEPQEVKLNFIRSILLENNIVI